MQPCGFGRLVGFPRKSHISMLTGYTVFRLISVPLNYSGRLSPWTPNAMVATLLKSKIQQGALIECALLYPVGKLQALQFFNRKK